MKVLFLTRGWDDYSFWVETDIAVARRLNVLIRDCQRSPFVGLGRPEPLKHEFKGWWSRRLNNEHRLIYRVIGTGDDQRLEIAQCRFHY